LFHDFETLTTDRRETRPVEAIAAMRDVPRKLSRGWGRKTPPSGEQEETTANIRIIVCKRTRRKCSARRNAKTNNHPVPKMVVVGIEPRLDDLMMAMTLIKT
jgi:hypothetical protein